MNRARVLRLAAPILMALGINGCVAAALPALAGAAMVRSETQETTSVTVDPAAVDPVAQASPEALASRPADLPAEVMLGPAPPPGDEAASNPAIDSPYLNMIAFARTRALDGAGSGSPRLSAMLSNPASLDGKRKPCHRNNPVVLIDLDPHGGSVDPAAAPTASPALAQGLQSLREQGIDIAWISASTAAMAGDIRAALKSSGLDPQGEDRLILMRYRGDRKQTRREELANETCLVAIAGDHRADFDELFEYLVNPDAALGLELLIGQGWFLVSPLLGKQ